MQLQTYLFFDGHCDEALDFYCKVLGAEVTTLMRYKDSPDQSMINPDSADKVMHSSFRLGDQNVLASDGHCTGRTNFQGFSLTLTVPDEATADRLFNALSEGGEVRAPLAKTFFSPRFGMLADRFGVGWIILAEH